MEECAKVFRFFQWGPGNCKGGQVVPKRVRFSQRTPGFYKEGQVILRKGESPKVVKFLVMREPSKEVKLSKR